MGVCLVWFRNDLRLTDQPALEAALATGWPVVPVYILDEEAPGLRAAGGASRWWMHQSIAALDASLRAVGSRLTLRRGPAEQVLLELAGLPARTYPTRIVDHAAARARALAAFHNLAKAA